MMIENNISIDNYVNAFVDIGKTMNLTNFEVKKSILDGNPVIMANYENGKLVEILFNPKLKKAEGYGHKGVDSNYFSLIQQVADKTQSGPYSVVFRVE